ncbi:MAG: YhcB family protein [Colwellia sp.]
MEFTAALVIFIIGGSFGFLARHLLINSSSEKESLVKKANKSDAALAQYKIDVAEHLDNSSKLLEQMNDTCQTAMAQMKESTALLQQASVNETVAMPFFSEETNDELAKTAVLRHKPRKPSLEESITEPPLDYSNTSSGLFIDKQNKEVAPSAG